MMIMRHKGENGHLQHAYTEDELKKCRVRLFNHILDIFQVVIPINKFYYDWKEHGVQNNPWMWKQKIIDSVKPRYDHDTRWQRMKVRKIKSTVNSNRSEGKMVTNEDF